MRSSDLLCGTLILAVSVMGSRANGEPDSGKPVVSGVGTATVHLAAERLRLEVVLPAHGANAVEALRHLKEIQAKAKSKLEKLGAADGTTSFSEPRLSEPTGGSSSGDSPPLQTGRRIRVPVIPSAAVSLTSVLRAEWKLKAKSTEDLVVEAQELEEKIRAADLGGTRQQGGNNGVDDEAAEEAQALVRQGSEGDGTPRFIFAAQISESDRRKAFVEALAKARADAANLAAAAGLELGQMRMVSRSGTLSPSARGTPAADPGRSTDSENVRESGTDARGSQPTEISYSVTINASYSVK